MLSKNYIFIPLNQNIKALQQLIKFLKITFTKYLFLLLLIFWILSLQFGETSTYGISKTVGWAYNVNDLQFVNAVVFPLSQILFLFGYLVIMTFRRKTNFYLSLGHFLLIFISFLTTSREYFILGFVCCLASLVLFFINLAKSYR